MRTIALALILSACTPTVLPSPPPSGVPTGGAPASTTPSVLPTNAASAEPTPIAPSVRSIPPGAETFDLLEVRSEDSGRLWLIDPRLERAPVLVAKWSPAFEVGAHASASADRSKLVISAVTASRRAALYLIETRTGTVRLLVEDPTADLLGPVIDGRGVAVAYTRRSRGPIEGDDGIWVVRLDGGAPRRIVAGSGSTQAWSWSADGAWLAYTPSGFPHTAIATPVHVISADGARRVDTGLTGGAEWHPTRHQLLVTVSAPPDSRDASRVLSYDVLSGGIATLYRSRVAEAFLCCALWKPDGTEFALVEHSPAVGENEVVRVRVGGGEQRPARAAHIFRAFWSSDRLIAVIGGDDSVLTLLDVATGRSTQVCLRSDDPTRCV